MRPKRVLCFFLLSLGCLCVPALALAAGSQGFVLASILNKLIQLIQSDLARSLFVLAIAGVGYGWLFVGIIPKEKAMGAFAGIGIVLSASYLADYLGIVS